jgi:mRNA guanylyltransferase
MDMKEITNVNYCNYLTKFITYNWNYRGNPQFPCPQPVSIERKDFEKLNTYDYFVGVKNDGVRYIMIFTTDKQNRKQCIMCDRNLKFYKIDISGDETLFNGTLFDGELIGDKFVVYDSVLICGNKINKQPYSIRLAETDMCIRTLIQPFKFNKFEVISKTFYKLSDFSKFIEEEYNDKDNIDGLIFMPEKLPVMTGTQFSMFKWKPSNKHTVDFLIKVVNENLEAYVYHENNLIKFANILQNQEPGAKFIEQFKQLDNYNTECILECLFLKETQNFKPILIRTDKNFPNSLRTVERTLFNAEENITIDEFQRLKTKD